MIDPKKVESLGFHQMHSMQIEALMNFVNMGLNLAAMCGDQDIMNEAEAEADELIRLFGGNGVRLKIENY
jgi:hypothetical protein